ncbi:hypothetical protein FT663_00667 [Candidozyma haemuli var. vulneris]|nr:hypothetical protein FT662_02050 [[Candida] haemuloni var. vulneris]KAF3995289.1 hypothetical protein FT663_00667 [[Candida] haemuloni var. vulneris]
MFLATFVLLFTAFLSVPSLGFPIYVRTPTSPYPQGKHQVNGDDGTRLGHLQNLVVSQENKAIFTKLLYADNAYYDKDTHTLGTLDWVPQHQYQRQPYVANGYLGSRIPNLGQGFAYDTLANGTYVDVSTPDADLPSDLSNGWPLFNRRYAGAFVAGFYNLQENTTSNNFPWLLEDGYESVVAAVPQWTSLALTAKKGSKSYTLDPAGNPDSYGKITNYAQNLSLADGIVTTTFTWLGSLDVKYTVLAHRSKLSLGLVSLHVENTADSNITVSVQDSLDFGTAQRARFDSTSVDKENRALYMLYSPNDIDYVYGATYSSLRYDTSESHCLGSEFTTSHFSSGHTVTFDIPAKSSIDVTKHVGVVTSDLDPKKYTSFDLVLSEAKATSLAKDSFESLSTSHREEWGNSMDAGLTVEFPDDPLLSLAARASIYHLNANTRPDAEGVTAALGVSGLSSDSYGGMVFWDTDLWMMNGLLPFNPSHARSIVNYRLHTHDQARKNVDSDRTPKKDMHGAAFPWTSGRFGNCTATGPCFDYEYHINMAVAISAWELYKSGAADDHFLEHSAFPLINDAAALFADYVEYNDTLQAYSTHNLTDPDEYANHVDNGAYTNSAISATMRWAIAVSEHLGKPVPKSYQNIMGNMHLPRSADDSDIILEFTGMNSSIEIKQADVVMLTYPLENELITLDSAKASMEYASMKQVSFGPAMTFPIFSIVSSALSEKGCSADTYLMKSIQPFLRGPFAQFSEQNSDDYLTNGGTHPAFPFMTAHGGFLQAILQGILGLRFDHKVEDGKIVRFLKLDPIKLKTLPSGVYFDGVHYMNQTLAFNLTSEGLAVKHNGPIKGSVPHKILIELGSRNPDAGTHTLMPGTDATFKLYETEDTFKNSLSECGRALFTNITECAPGDAPVLANDGDNTTHWQAKTPEKSKVLIDFLEPIVLQTCSINWGDKPPKSVKLSATAQDLSSEYPDLLETVDFLSNVDFGTDLPRKYSYNNPGGKLYKQSDIFTAVDSREVSINEPFRLEEQHLIVLPSRHNTTDINLDSPIKTRYALLEFEGVHDKRSKDDKESQKGAKIYELNFF